MTNVNHHHRRSSCGTWFPRPFPRSDRNPILVVVRETTEMILTRVGPVSVVIMRPTRDLLIVETGNSVVDSV